MTALSHASHLPYGDITGNGAVGINENLEGETVVPVTGGTGAFRNVSGAVAIIPAEDLSHSALVCNVKNGKAGC